MTNNKDKIIKRIEKSIKSLDKRDFTLYFFVVDCNNVPNGNMFYIYSLAKTLHDENYNVKLVYQLKDEYTKKELEELKRKNKPIEQNRVFVGVGEWLGKSYSELPHMNISQEEWKVSPCDFLFIPEVFPSLMKQSFKAKIPCKRIVVLHNYDYITEFIPFGDEWGSYGIHDVITTTDYQKNMIQSVFPYVKVDVLKPYISPLFRHPIKAKQLIVNIISKRKEDVNRIMKNFYWKYPAYKFILFRDLRGFPKDKFAEYLQESAITVWLDTETPFGYSALEAMACENIIIGKVPEVIPDWMQKDGELLNNGIWTYNINDIPDILAKVIGTFMQDNIPDSLFEDMKNTIKNYTIDEWNNSVKQLFAKYVEDRKREFNEVITTIKSNK